MAVNWLSFNHESYVTELRLVQDVQEVLLITGAQNVVKRLCIQRLTQIELTDTLILYLILLLLLRTGLSRPSDPAALIIRHLGRVSLKNTAHVLVTIIHSS